MNASASWVSSPGFLHRARRRIADWLIGSGIAFFVPIASTEIGWLFSDWPSQLASAGKFPDFLLGTFGVMVLGIWNILTAVVRDDERRTISWVTQAIFWGVGLVFLALSAIALTNWGRLEAGSLSETAQWMWHALTPSVLIVGALNELAIAHLKK